MQLDQFACKSCGYTTGSANEYVRVAGGCPRCHTGLGIDGLVQRGYVFRMRSGYLFFENFAVVVSTIAALLQLLLPLLGVLLRTNDH